MFKVSLLVKALISGCLCLLISRTVERYSDCLRRWSKGIF
nr:MAG TPA: hypothetical protein [Caudoviricetes sp.]DAQ99441.1 MAG TPA: hypothetical protein [Caudoviricetes sp.]